MALGKRLINTGAVAACTTDSADVFGDSSGVALYTLDYDASDASGNYDGTPTDVDFGVGGHINTGARFNGSSSKIVLPSIDWTTLTISFWINARSDSEGGNRNNVASDGTINRNCIFINKNYITDGRVPLNSISYFDSNYANSVSATWEDDTWIHIAVTLSGQDMAIYKNGTLADSATISGRPTGNKTYNWGKNGTSFFTGNLDQVRIFSKALNQTEVDTLYAETACVYTATTTDNNYPTTNLAYYKMDNSAEDEKGSYDATPTEIEYRFGKYGQAAVFSSDSSFFNTGLTDSNLGTSYSVSLWAYADVLASSPDYYSIIGKYSTGSGNLGYILSATASGNISFFGYFGNQNTTSTSFNSSQTFKAGIYHHIVLVFDGSTEVRLYVDNVKTTQSVSSTINQNSVNLMIGSADARTAVQRNFIGNIDQVRVFATALSDSQVTELYNEKPEVDTSNFKAVLYEGNSGHNYISNVGFQPDLTWVKFRNTAVRHMLTDSVRGTASQIFSNELFAAQNYLEFTSFDENGFTVDYNSGSQYFNTTGLDYVAWNWKGGGDAVNIGVNSITGSTPSIASDVSANTAAGFSIVKVNNHNNTQTIGHGLSQAPEVIFQKTTNSSSYGWYVYHKDVGNDKYLQLNTTAEAVSDNFWNYTTPTDTVFTHRFSTSSFNMIFYCWHSVAGYSKIGSYTGDGTTSNTVSAPSFEPSFVMIKRTDSTSNWRIFDNARGTNVELYANSSSQDVSATGYINFNSNGFEITTTGGWLNADGGTYLYMAFK